MPITLPETLWWRCQVNDRYSISIAQTAESCQELLGPKCDLPVPREDSDDHRRLDDPDYPAYTTGQAAQMLEVRQAFLRALDAAGAVIPVRSGGGHRRYSRRQLLFARRVREVFDQGHNLASALRILSLQDDLATERDLVTSLRDQLGQHRGHGHDPADDS